MITRNHRCRRGIWLLPTCIIIAVSTFSCHLFSSPEASFRNNLAAEVLSKTAWIVQDGDTIAIDLVRPLINGQDLGWFALDTGSPVLAIDKRHAAQLDLSSVGKAMIPECNMPVSFLSGASLDLGRLRLDDAILAALDLSSLNRRIQLDVQLAGIIGAPLFDAAIVQIEYGDTLDRISLFDPATFDHNEIVWQSMDLRDQKPVIHARLEGNLSGDFLLDTGKGGNLSLYADFIETHNLLANREVVRKKNSRLCGDTDEFSGQIEWFEFGGKRFDNPTVRFKIPGTLGSEGEDNTIGTIGRGFLRYFTVVFDYQEERLALILRGIQ